MSCKVELCVLICAENNLVFINVSRYTWIQAAVQCVFILSAAPHSQTWNIHSQLQCVVLDLPFHFSFPFFFLNQKSSHPSCASFTKVSTWLFIMYIEKYRRSENTLNLYKCYYNRAALSYWYHLFCSSNHIMSSQVNVRMMLSWWKACRHTYPCSENSSIPTFQHLLQFFVCCCFPSWKRQVWKGYQHIAVGSLFILAFVNAGATYWSPTVSEYVLYSSPWSPLELRYISSSLPQTSWTARHARRQNDKHLGVFTNALAISSLNFLNKRRFSAKLLL